MNVIDRIGEAMVKLGESDTPYAKLETNAMKMDKKAERVKAAIFLHETGNNEERKAKALVSEEYWSAYEEYLAADEARRDMKYMREQEDRAIQVGRTIEASRRKA